uniref:Uncharacterized protein n=1 Tax=Mucochytrium quahogii TaxID=96639 RepID=A0A7S2S4M8_9STRA|mmetsp:Transcript_8938/g.14536  ORF Transcript_8938/g.14536 Transcript_8938/m.14536 type:complete len:279 (+) Transcript_8938:286-1122(+)
MGTEINGSGQMLFHNLERNDGLTSVSSTTLSQVIHRHFRNPELRRLAERVIVSQNNGEARPRRDRSKGKKYASMRTRRYDHQRDSTGRRYSVGGKPLARRQSSSETSQATTVTETETEAESWKDFDITQMRIDENEPIDDNSSVDDVTAMLNRNTKHGPTLLEFRDSSFAKHSVGQMTFNPVMQKWENTCSEEEDDIMAAFETDSFSEDDADDADDEQDQEAMPAVNTIAISVPDRAHINKSSNYSLGAANADYSVMTHDELGQLIVQRLVARSKAQM